MYSDTGNTTSLVLGFPIRTSSDPRSVDSSPRHIAASHVLHRPLMPRHPPCALKHLQQKTQKPKNNSEKITPQQTNTRSSPDTLLRKGNAPRPNKCQLDARNHYPRIKHHTPPPSGATTHQPESSGPPKHSGDDTTSGSPNHGAKRRRACCLKAQ
jgi:hypothetical protein